jgi:uncharacterized protein with PQ loop repeat
VPIVLKSGSLNLLEPSGPVKACNGIGLPLDFTVMFTGNFCILTFEKASFFCIYSWFIYGVMASDDRMVSEY